MHPLLEITEPAHLDRLARLRSFVEAACEQTGVDPTTCFALQLAVDEVCTNIIVHGYADREPGSIHLSFQHDQGQVKITIIDQGCPFDPQQAPHPDLAADWEERKIGGMGIYLVQTIMDEICYQANTEQGNRLVLIKSLPSDL